MVGAPWFTAATVVVGTGRVVGGASVVVGAGSVVAGPVNTSAERCLPGPPDDVRAITGKATRPQSTMAVATAITRRRLRGQFRYEKRELALPVLSPPAAEPFGVVGLSTRSRPLAQPMQSHDDIGDCPV